MSARRWPRRLVIAMMAGPLLLLGPACTKSQPPDSKGGLRADPGAFDAGITASTSTAPTSPAATAPVPTDHLDAGTSGRDNLAVHPTTVAGLSGVGEIAAMDDLTCARLADGTLKWWGRACDNGPTGPTTVPRVDGAVRLASANAAVVGDGKLVTYNRCSPGAVFAYRVDDADEFGTNSHDYICARRKAGTVACLHPHDFYNGYQELSPIPGFRDARRLSVGSDAVCAIGADGVVRCQGSTRFGRLGNGDGGSRGYTTKATPIRALRDVSAITIGDKRSCAIRGDGGVMCWGSGFGTFGTNATDQPAPAPIAGLSAVVELALGSEHTCARHYDGTVSCWGWNDRGQLGDGTTHQRMLPVKVPGLSGIKQIAAGASHTCALRPDAAVVCWGDNQRGQVGVPVTVGCLGEGQNTCTSGKDCCTGLYCGAMGYCRKN